MSVTLKYRDQIVRNTSKIIPRLIILAFSVCRDHNIMDLLQRKHHEISAETGILQMTCYILNIDSHNPFTSAFKLGLPLTSSLLLEYSSEYLNEYSSTR